LPLVGLHSSVVAKEQTSGFLELCVCDEFNFEPSVEPEARADLEY